MQWQRLLSSAAAVVGAAAVGCDSAAPVRAADPGGPPTAQVRPAGDLGEARMQKPEADARPAGRVVATVRALVNGVPILDDEVAALAIPQIANLRMAPEDPAYKDEVKKIKAAALELLIERELLVQEAETRLRLINKLKVLDEVKDEADRQLKLKMKAVRANFKSDEEFDAFLRAHGTSMEEQKRTQRRILIAQEFLRNNVIGDAGRRAGHQEVYAYYKAHPEEFQRSDGVSWQDIFIDAAQYPSRQAAQRLADDLAARARAGGSDDFVKLCEKYDNGLAKTKKGAGIGSRREDISPPEAAGVLFEMRDGDVGPVIAVPAGFHVIRLVKRTYAGLAPFDEEVQKAIKDKLLSEAIAVESKRYLEELKKKVRPERFPF